MRTRFRLSHLSAGFVAVLVAYTSSAAIIFQAAAGAGATPEQISSWLWALGIGLAATTIGLSVFYRTPVMTAWSTPGAALLVTAMPGLSLNEAVGAFLFSSVLLTVCGVTGWFDRLMQQVPRPLAAALLAGVLLQFGMNTFNALGDEVLLVGVMLGCYLLTHQLVARYAVALTLLVGTAVALLQGQLQFEALSWTPASPVWVTPAFSLAALVGVGVPLFIVTMASQNMPGIAVLRAHGYGVPASPLVGWTGLAGVLLAPFGGFAYNLAAITAAICMGEEVDQNPRRRYLATVWAGIFYLLAGLFAATVTGLFTAFPTELVIAIAGLALIGTIGNGLQGALSEPVARDAALLTFLITASDLAILGVGSAFWGVLIGLAAYHLRVLARRYLSHGPGS